MPRRPRPGVWATLYAEVPPDVKAWLQAQADANNRSATAELLTLLQAHLDPKFKPHAEPTPPPESPKKRKRKTP